MSNWRATHFTKEEEEAQFNYLREWRIEDAANKILHGAVNSWIGRKQ